MMMRLLLFVCFFARKYVCMCIIAFFFPFGRISSCSHLCLKRRVGWHNSTVGLTLLEVWARSVQCVARGKPFKLFWPWAHLRQIPGFPQHPRGDWVSASLIPAYARKIWMQTRCLVPTAPVSVDSPRWAAEWLLF